MQDPKGRGSSSFQTDQNSGIVALPWYVSKCVSLVSTYIPVDKEDTMRRWNSKIKSFVQQRRPVVVEVCNISMEGFDLIDMLIALYRCKINTKRWYLVILFHGPSPDAASLPYQIKFNLLHQSYAVCHRFQTPNSNHAMPY